MRSLAIESFRRSELERWIDHAVDASEQARWTDEAIYLLDEMDGDTDLEDDEIDDIDHLPPVDEQPVDKYNNGENGQ